MLCPLPIVSGAVKPVADLPNEFALRPAEALVVDRDGEQDLARASRRA
jgi:hypothetical protein